MKRLTTLLPLLLFLAACAHHEPITASPTHWGDRAAPSTPPEPAGKPMDMRAVAAAYSGSCSSGQRLSNNCAHFLADAIIRAGCDDLLTSDLVTERCPAGRPIRAQDLLKWFQANATDFHMGIPENDGLWFGYQEKPGRRHVLLLDSDTGRFYGTDHCKDWPVQWFYRW